MLTRYPYLYEIPLAFLLLYGVNQLLFPEAPGFVGIDPHPYWLGILLFGFRYGVAAGLIAGVLSAVVYLFSAWFFVERYLFEEWIFYLLPSFFIIVGVTIGVGVQRYRLAIRRERDEKGRLAQEGIALKEELKTQTEIVAGLEKRIATRMSTLVTLYEGARRLESVEREELYTAILEFVAKTLEAGEAALYLSSDEGWRCEASRGWKEYEKRPRLVKPNEGLIGMAGSKGKIVSIREFLDARKGVGSSPTLLGDCLMAGPLRQGETGEVIGVLAIQELPFASFNSAAMSLFAFLLTWASRALGHAHYVHELKAQEIIDPEYQVYSYRYFQSRLQQEFSRSKTYYLPLGVGLVGLSATSAPQKRPVLLAVSELLRSCCRDMDVIAHFPEPGIPFVVLFITASPLQVNEMKGRIEERFSRLGLSDAVAGPIALRVGISNFTPQIQDAAALVRAAQGHIQDAAAQIPMEVR